MYSFLLLLSFFVSYVEVDDEASLVEFLEKGNENPEPPFFLFFSFFNYFIYIFFNIIV